MKTTIMFIDQSALLRGSQERSKPTKTTILARRKNQLPFEVCRKEIPVAMNEKQNG